MSSTKQTADIHKTLVLGATAPYVIKAFDLSWMCMRITFEEWLDRLNDKTWPHSTGVPFETGNLLCNQYPQWERCRKVLKLTPNEFLEQFHHNPEPVAWASYSYKHLNELPPQCREGISFAALGFKDLDDISFWLGSKGAHTSCHYDTYGCNIVVQVYGRKSWLLFPPKTRLTASRVPYEESSVYCEQNFFSPSDLGAFQEVKENAHYVVLEPGDVLIVPPKWWHFVENLETSLSFNTWIPLDTDLEAQLEECMVKIKISQLTQTLPDGLKRAIVNPNELDNLKASSFQEQLRLLRHLAKCLLNEEARAKLDVQSYHSSLLTDNAIDSLRAELIGVSVATVANISGAAFFDILKTNGLRFVRSEAGTIEQTADYKNIADYINVECCPATLELMKSKILKKYFESFA